MASSAATLSPAQIASVMRSVGWPESAIAVGVAIARAESGGNPNAVNTANSNGSTDRGLFQINSIHAVLLRTGDVFNATDNARMALTIYRQAGNSFRPWSTFNNGRYRMFMDGDTGPTAAQGLTDMGTIGTADSGLSVLTSADTWKRVALFIAGALLILIILASMMGKQLPIAKAIRKVG